MGLVLVVLVVLVGVNLHHLSWVGIVLVVLAMATWQGIVVVVVVVVVDRQRVVRP